MQDGFCNNKECLPFCIIDSDSKASEYAWNSRANSVMKTLCYVSRYSKRAEHNLCKYIEQVNVGDEWERGEGPQEYCNLQLVMLN